jgi:hypothetical protein
MQRFQTTQNMFCVQTAGMKNALWRMLALLLVLVLVSCATTQTPVSFNPRSINEVRFRDRSQTKFDEEVRVTTAVPTAEETEAIFGADLARKEIQPIWVKVENHSDRTYYLVIAGVDPNYFSPIESSYGVRSGLSETDQEAMENHFRAMNFRNPVLPDTAVSGFIFTNLDEGEKVVQVDLIADTRAKFFTFFVQIPGIRVDYQMVDFDSLYPAKEIVELSQDKLKVLLETLPCCTTNEEGTKLGDPLNLVIVGHFHEVAAVDAGIKTIADLKGKRVNLGNPGSGQYQNAIDALEAVGLDQNTDIVAEKARATEAPRLLQDNRIDAFFCTLGHPSETLREAVAGSRKVRFIPITGPGIEKLIADRNYYTKTILPVAEFYRGAQDPVNVETFGVIATLCTSVHLPDHVVYVVTKEVFGNFDHFRKQHPAYAGLTKEGMLEGLTAPLHPGAIKYFKEAGLVQ